MFKIQKSLQIIVLASCAIVLESPTFALTYEVSEIKKSCDSQFPNAAFHQCQQDNRCQGKTCEATCNAVDAVQRINKKYDACVSNAMKK